MPNGRQGFTLIEMLVVIAIIGILSAAVLVALGPSRNKAKDARIISALEQARILWETQYDGSAGTYPSDMLSDEYVKIKADILANGGSAPVITMAVLNKNGSISSTLNSGSLYCIDTVGTSIDNAQVIDGLCEKIP